MRSWNVTDGARASQSVRGGFTLIEILIVVAIIALIIVFVFGGFGL